MKWYAYFLTKDANGNECEAMGTDGVFRLDGRNSLFTMLDDAIKRMSLLMSIHPNYHGLKIVKCSAIGSNESVLYTWRKYGNNS